jgi:hypothetical protein
MVGSQAQTFVSDLSEDDDDDDDLNLPDLARFTYMLLCGDCSQSQPERRHQPKQTKNIGNSRRQAPGWRIIPKTRFGPKELFFWTYQRTYQKML